MSWGAGTARADSANPPAPVVAMRPTIWRVVPLNIVGAAPPPGPYGVGAGGASVVLAGGGPVAERVILLNRTAGTVVVVATSTQELDVPTGVGVIPGGAYALFLNQPALFVLAPGQRLYGAALALAVPVPATVSVAASVIIPRSQRRNGELLPTTFRTFQLAATGTPGAAVRVAPASKRPQRVVVDTPPLSTNYRLTSASSELEGGTVNPAGAFAFDGAAPPLVFVLAPDQPLYASVDPASPISTMSISVSEIDTTRLAGETGVPGAGAIE